MAINPLNSLPGVVPTVIVQAFNAVAIAAANAGEMDTVSMLQQFAGKLPLLPTAYQNVAPTTTPFLNFNGYPVSFQNFDVNAAVAKQLGLLGTQLGA